MQRTAAIGYLIVIGTVCAISLFSMLAGVVGSPPPAEPDDPASVLSAASGNALVLAMPIAVFALGFLGVRPFIATRTPRPKSKTTQHN
ncbi:MAG: hypothetical protein M1370_11930 [Bacteroidetes bacterium]|nr:hypothetical protein [Bacteroidota bacterium]MCL5025656.1 hypothetical protein [Chloroflexota bacterium]